MQGASIVNRMFALTPDLRALFRRAAGAALQVCGGLCSLTTRFMRAAHDIGHEAARDLRLTGEGLIHIREASPAIREEAARDLATCAIETGLAVAEDVAFEASLAVAALETAEKIIDRPAEKNDAVTCAAEFAEGLTSSAVAAAHAAANLAGDLEAAGLEWEARRARNQSVNPISSAASASSIGMK